MNVVLYEPDIPGNTGNVARSCVATGTTLHLVGRLGFKLDEPRLKRAGLDYWPKLKLVRHEDWESFLKSRPAEPPLFFFSKRAARSYWSAVFHPESYLVFGCETQGLPPAFHQRYGERMYAIPMASQSVRSLNLSSAAAIILYEALRQTNPASTLILHDRHPSSAA